MTEFHMAMAPFNQTFNKQLLVFHRKDLCKARPQTPSVFKFSDVLFALNIRWTLSRGIYWPRAVLHQVSLTFGKPLGQTDLQPDGPLVETPCDQEWVLCQVSLTFVQPLGQADLQSDVPMVEASSGQKWYYIRSAWHLVSLWVRLTFSQMDPPVEASHGQEWYLGPVDLNSDITPSRGI